MKPRRVAVYDILRYARGASPIEVMLDGYPNYYFLMASPGSSQPKIMLERGINATACVAGPDGSRRPVIAIRSSPWKAGHATNPWHDEFDLDHGHVRYYGDHKPSTDGLPGVTAGNRALLDAWRFHAGTNSDERVLAPPLLLFRSSTVHWGGRSIVKGHVEFCGAALIERLEHVVQRDPVTGRSFPNILLDLAVVDMSESGDTLDLRWVDDRRDASLTAIQANRHAPQAWKRWIREGSAAIPRIRRRVVSSRVKSHEDQLPTKGSADADVLRTLYRFFDGRKHAFEHLASRVTAQLLSRSGATYRDGWLTRVGGDGGMDFVGRLDVGSPGSTTPLVVLGQAKCIAPESSVSPDQVARVVARLRRGWLGVFVTTGTFSKQAQIEVIDDQYPLVLVPGRILVEQVLRLAAADYGADLDALLADVLEGYPAAVTHRRPEEVLLG
ncbi:restriction endonuclease [Actinopolymorpha alba]|uniref:restriction endonuclease n=1 Tax=Actinopolymorpha alba TaxID=533267 RepID=UPI00036ED25E|nr:restriction endonuclease [Actinopolymorpha alba]